MLKTATLNIGMHTSARFGKVRVLTRKLIERTLAEHGYTVVKSLVVPSGPEPTFVAVVVEGDDEVTAGIAALSALLAQDCIAVLPVGNIANGVLRGPYASLWGEFDRSSFYTWEQGVEARLRAVDAGPEQHKEYDADYSARLDRHAAWLAAQPAVQGSTPPQWSPGIPVGARQARGS